MLSSKPRDNWWLWGFQPGPSASGSDRFLQKLLEFFFFTFLLPIAKLTVSQIDHVPMQLALWVQIYPES